MGLNPLNPTLFGTPMPVSYLYTVSQNITTLIVINFYTLEPILIIFGALYAETTGF